MKPTAQSGRNTSADHTASPELAAAIDLLWTRFLPEIRQRVDILQAAAAAFATNQLSTALRESANAAAHKLAGTLGTFNLTRGTVLAREFELLCSRKDAPDLTCAERLASIAAELRIIVDSRE